MIKQHSQGTDFILMSVSHGLPEYRDNIAAAGRDRKGVPRVFDHLVAGAPSGPARSAASAATSIAAI